MLAPPIRADLLRLTMHREAFEFIRDKLAALAPGSLVLEIGSYIVNGSAREAAKHLRNWVGLDRRPGPGVDIVCRAGDYDGCGHYDVVVSAETLEHCQDHREIIGCAARALRPGGLLVLTAATPERAPHDDDGQELPPERLPIWNPVTVKSLTNLLGSPEWREVNIVLRGKDIYATAQRAEGSGLRAPLP